MLFGQGTKVKLRGRLDVFDILRTNVSCGLFALSQPFVLFYFIIIFFLLYVVFNKLLIFACSGSQTHMTWDVNEYKQRLCGKQKYYIKTDGDDNVLRDSLVAAREVCV